MQARLRNGNTFKAWPQLAEEVAHSVRAHNVIVDGEIWLPEPWRLEQLLQSAVPAWLATFVTFDLLAVDCEDLRPLPLLARKRPFTRHYAAYRESPPAGAAGSQPGFLPRRI